MVEGEDAIGGEDLLQEERRRADLARRVFVFLLLVGRRETREVDRL
jgi:hypothetical protein